MVQCRAGFTPRRGQLLDLPRLQLSPLHLQTKGPDPQHIYNTHVVVSSEGRVCAHYAKVHLFNVNVKDGPVLMESGCG